MITTRWCLWVTSHCDSHHKQKIVIHPHYIIIVQPSISGVKSVMDFYCCWLLSCWLICSELPPFACACFSSSRQCSQLQKCPLGLHHPLTVRAWSPEQHITTLDCCTTQRKQTVSSHAVEGRHQSRPGLHEFHPGQPTVDRRVSGKFLVASWGMGNVVIVHTITTLALPHNATKIQGSCPQRSGEALELS